METSESTITVVGRSRGHMPPDLVILNMVLQSVEADFEKAGAASEKAYAALLETLQQAGYAPEQVRTADYEVKSEYEYRQEKNSSRRVFIGVRVFRKLELKLAFEARSLAALLQQLSLCRAEPEIDVSFALSDPKKFKAQLLREAAADARSAAEVLADAEGMTLGTLIDIRYDVEDDMPRPVNLKAAGACLSAPAAFNPSDIEAEESAEFSWKLEKAVR